MQTERFRVITVHHFARYKLATTTQCSDLPHSAVAVRFSKKHARNTRFGDVVEKSKSFWQAARPEWRTVALWVLNHLTAVRQVCCSCLV